MRHITHPPNSIAFSCACFIFDEICKKLKTQNRIIIGLSGGGSPWQLYRDLSCCLNTSEIERLLFFVVDERLIPLSHEESNSGRIITSFTKAPSVFKEKFNFIHPNPSLPPEDCLSDYQKALERNKIIHPDLIVLGVGPDGHTASLFPGDEVSPANANAVLTKRPNEDYHRLTITEFLIMNAANLVFFVPGANKKEIINRILIPGTSLPAQRILHTHLNATLFTL